MAGGVPAPAARPGRCACATACRSLDWRRMAVRGGGARGTHSRRRKSCAWAHGARVTHQGRAWPGLEGARSTALSSTREPVPERGPSPSAPAPPPPVPPPSSPRFVRADWRPCACCEAWPPAPAARRCTPWSLCVCHRVSFT
jgi:hypothetical protein